MGLCWLLTWLLCGGQMVNCLALFSTCREAHRSGDAEPSGSGSLAGAARQCLPHSFQLHRDVSMLWARRGPTSRNEGEGKPPPCSLEWEWCFHQRGVLAWAQGLQRDSDLEEERSRWELWSLAHRPFCGHGSLRRAAQGRSWQGTGAGEGGTLSLPGGCQL